MRFATLLLAASFALPGLALAQTTTTTSKMAPNASTTAAAPKAVASSPAATSAPAASGGVGQYSSEAAATSACSGDTVVWANATSKALHMSGTKYYGKTKHGFYNLREAGARQRLPCGRQARRAPQEDGLIGPTP